MSVITEVPVLSAEYFVLWLVYGASVIFVFHTFTKSCKTATPSDRIPTTTSAELNDAPFLPYRSTEELIESKMKRKGMTREEAIQDILDTATKTNESVNNEFGIEE